MGTDNYLGVVIGKQAPATTKYQSLQQKNTAALNLFNSSHLVFAASSSSVFQSQAGLVDQFDLFNSDTTQAHEITSLKIYTGLNLSYFNQANFNSAAALSSGQFLSDWADDTGGISISIANGNDVAADFVPVAGASLNSYDLLIGTAAPIISDGVLGTPFDFSIASQPIPEPPTIALSALCASAFLLVLHYARNR